MRRSTLVFVAVLLAFAMSPALAQNSDNAFDKPAVKIGLGLYMPMDSDLSESNNFGLGGGFTWPFVQDIFFGISGDIWLLDNETEDLAGLTDGEVERTMYGTDAVFMAYWGRGVSVGRGSYRPFFGAGAGFAWLNYSEEYSWTDSGNPVSEKETYSEFTYCLRFVAGFEFGMNNMRFFVQGELVMAGDIQVDDQTLGGSLTTDAEDINPSAAAVVAGFSW